jgi:hypothetical protein
VSNDSPPAPLPSAAVDDLKAQARALRDALEVLEEQAGHLKQDEIQSAMAASRLRLNEALRKFLES